MHEDHKNPYLQKYDNNNSKNISHQTNPSPNEERNYAAEEEKKRTRNPNVDWIPNYMESMDVQLLSPVL